MGSSRAGDNGRRARILLAVGGNSYGQVVTIALQLASFPVFLSVWSAAEYGVWLTAIALQAYLVLADFGIVSATTSRLTVLISRRADRGANQLLKASQSAVLLMAILLSLFAVGLGLALPHWGVSVEYATVIPLLIVNVAINQFTALGCGVLRATHQNHLAAVSSANARLAEWVGGVVLLVITQSPTWTAAGMLIGQSCAAIVVIRRSHRGTQFRWRPSVNGLKLSRFYLRQSSANFSISLSRALSIQGLTVIVAVAFGAAEVVTFNAYRTVSRVVVQATAVLSHAAWPEYGRLSGRSDRAALRRLYHRTQALSLIMTAGLTAVVLISIPLFLPIWTRGEVQPRVDMSLLFGAYAVAASLWHVPRVLLTAIGRNGALSVVTVMSSAIGVLAAATAAVLGSMFMVLVAMIAIELVCAVTASVIIHRALRGG